jgi:hypothetical protein
MLVKSGLDLGALGLRSLFVASGVSALRGWLMALWPEHHALVILSPAHQNRFPVVRIHLKRFNLHRRPILVDSRRFPILGGSTTCTALGPGLRLTIGDSSILLFRVPSPWSNWISRPTRQAFAVDVLLGLRPGMFLSGFRCSIISLTCVTKIRIHMYPLLWDQVVKKNLHLL